jgi:hypothetical protein
MAKIVEACAENPDHQNTLISHQVIRTEMARFSQL